LIVVAVSNRQSQSTINGLVVENRRHCSNQMPAPSLTLSTPHPPRGFSQQTNNQTHQQHG
jgi:hypothetical protein